MEVTNKLLDIEKTCLQPPTNKATYIGQRRYYIIYVHIGSSHSNSNYAAHHKHNDTDGSEGECGEEEESEWFGQSYSFRVLLSEGSTILDYPVHHQTHNQQNQSHPTRH